MAHDVFISHSAKDKATADAVCAMLESNGIRCWIAPRDVLASREYGEAIIDAIEECRIMVLVFTANANASSQIRREIERAVNHGVAILPLRMEDVLPGKSLEYFIGNVHWLDALTPPFEAHLKNLAGTIKIVLARTEPGGSPPLPQEERMPASRSIGSAERFPEAADVREKAPAPRLLWNTRSWTWAAGTVSAVLLVAVFIGMHFTSHQASPAPSPLGTAPVQGIPGTAQPIGPGGAAPPPPPRTAPNNAASLRDTMSAIQKELSSIGTLNYTVYIQDKTGGGTSQKVFVKQFTNVVADPAQCRVSYHFRVLQAGAVTKDKDAWFVLPAVTSVVFEPESQLLTQENASQGHTNIATSTAPPVTALIVRRASVYNAFPFTDMGSANRFASNVKQAVKLCGGHLAN